MRKILSLLFPLVLAWPLLSSADPAFNSSFVQAHNDFFNVLLPDNSDMKLGYLLQPSNDEDGGPGKYDLQTFSGQLEIPIPLSTNTYLRAGGGYGARKYDFKELAGVPTSSSEDTLHKVYGLIGYGQFFNPDLLFASSARLGAYSDFSGGLSEDDFQLYLDGMFVYRVNPGTQLLLGLAYNKIFDDAPLIPLIGFRIVSSDGQLRLTLTAPVEVRVDYQLDQKTQLYAGAWIEGDQYRIQTGPTKIELDAQVQDRRIGGGFLYWFTDHLNLGVEGGATLGSQFEFKLDNAGQFNGDMQSAPYVAATVGLSL